MIPVSPANSKLVKDRVWINPVTSKIVLQPLEPDTDAHLHEESVISVRIQAEIGISEFCKRVVPGWNADDDEEFHQGRAGKTAVTPQVQR